MIKKDTKTKQRLLVEIRLMEIAYEVTEKIGNCDFIFAGCAGRNLCDI